MKLLKPIQAHGETVTELTFREPTGADITRNGFPFKYSESLDGQVRLFDAAVITKFIADLAGVPPSSVAQMTVVDYTRSMGHVVGFFFRSGTPEHLVEVYFDLAHRWNDLGVVMALPFSQLRIYVEQTNRITLEIVG